MNDNKLYKQARKRVEGKTKGRIISDEDVIIDQEKEIQYYREKIQKMTDEKQTDKEKEFKIEINDEEYLIKYYNDTDVAMLSASLIKLVNDTEINNIQKVNDFKVINIPRTKKRFESLKELI